MAKKAGKIYGTERDPPSSQVNSSSGGGGGGAGVNKGHPTNGN